MAACAYGWRGVCVCAVHLCRAHVTRVRRNVRFSEKKILIRLELSPKSTKIKYESIMHGIIANGMQIGLGWAEAGSWAIAVIGKNVPWPAATVPMLLMGRGRGRVGVGEL